MGTTSSQPQKPVVPQEEKFIQTRKIYSALFTNAITKFASLNYIEGSKIKEIFELLTDQISNTIKQVKPDQKSNNREFHEIIDTFNERFGKVFVGLIVWDMNRCDIIISCLHSETPTLEAISVNLPILYRTLLKEIKSLKEAEIQALEQMVKRGVEENEQLAKFHL